MKERVNKKRVNQLRVGALIDTCHSVMYIYHISKHDQAALPKAA